MGTCRFLFPGRNDAGKQRLWDEALHEAIPNLQRSPHQLERAVGGVYQLRNRVAHLGPLINSNVEAQLVNMCTVIGVMDPDLLLWSSSTERIRAVPISVDQSPCGRISPWEAGRSRECRRG